MITPATGFRSSRLNKTYPTMEEAQFAEREDILREHFTKTTPNWSTTDLVKFLANKEIRDKFIKEYDTVD